MLTAEAYISEHIWVVTIILSCTDLLLTMHYIHYIAYGYINPEYTGSAGGMMVVVV